MDKPKAHNWMWLPEARWVTPRQQIGWVLDMPRQWLSPLSLPGLRLLIGHKEQCALCLPDSTLVSPSSACFFSLVFMNGTKPLAFIQKPCMFRADVSHAVVLLAVAGWFRAGWNHARQKPSSKGYFFCFSWLWKISQITLGKHRRPQRQQWTSPEIPLLTLHCICL